MSKRPTQHWQDDSQEYTFNQYAFYLVVLGLMIGSLLVAYILSVWGSDIPVTHLVAIHSRPGDELPVIPYQDSDLAALEDAFPGFRNYRFDDKTSFKEEVINGLTTDYAENQDIDTMLVWLSAVGKLEDGKPVIIPSEPGETIEFSFLIEKLGQLTAQSVVLLLDCSHAFVNQQAYLDQHRIDSDFNKFADAVVESIPDSTGKVQVLVYGMPGQQPLYSTMRRRSLLAYALENTFVQNDTTEWDAEFFREELDELCFRFGGTATPDLKWPGADPPTFKFNRPEVKPSEDAAVNEEEKEEENGADSDEVEMASDKKKIIAALNDVWERFDISRNSLKLPPAAFAPERWDSLTKKLIELSADELQSGIKVDEIIGNCDDLGLQIDEFETSSKEAIEQISNNLKLEKPEDEDIVESEEVRDKRKVSNHFLRVHELRHRLPYYVAIADSLSWLFPDNQSVDRYIDCTRELVERFDRSDLAGVVFQQNASLDDEGQIDRISIDLLKKNVLLLDSLGIVCRNVIERSNGFQREMAVEAVLRLPFLEIEKPPEGDPRLKDRDRIFSREELLGLLAKSSLPNEDPRVLPSSRIAASTKRRELYQKFRDHVGEAGPKKNPFLSRRLQTFAYRLPVSDFDFQSFAVASRTERQIVRINNRNKLANSEQYIELEPTPIDLDLFVKLKNKGVQVRCEIIQNGEFFAFPGSTEQTSTFGEDENPVLIAKQEAVDEDPECLLLVTVYDDERDLRKPWDSFEVPIRLPTKNSIDLIVDFAAKKPDDVDKVREFIKEGIGERIRPFPNRELQCDFRLRNNWHKKRSGTISLYACVDPEVATIAGKINDNVIQRTKRNLDADKIAPIASAKYELPQAIADQAYIPVEIKWEPLPDWNPDGPPIFANHGFLCLITHDESGADDWHYWIPIFPLENSPVTVDPQTSFDDLVINIARREFVPPDMAVQVEWYFSDDKFAGGKKTLEPGELRHKTDILIRNVSQQMKPGTFLYFDVDNWPRKHVYIFDGTKFEISSISDARVDVKLGEPDEPEPKEPELIELASKREFDKAFGSKSDRRAVTVSIKPNVSAAATDFQFETAEDFIQLVKSDDSSKLFYPRKIVNRVTLAPKSGKINLESLVSDHQITFRDVGNRFEVSPVLSLGGEKSELADSNRVQIHFDQKAPVVVPNGVIVRPSSVEAGKPLNIQINAHDENGVGIDSSGIEIFLSKPGGRLPPFGERWPATRKADGEYEIYAPEKPGIYRVGVRVTDRVGLFTEEPSNNGVMFDVVAAKPIVEPKLIEPTIYTHELTVTVKERFGAAITIPELTIEPEPKEGTIEQVGNRTFIFKGLDGGVEYTVSGKCKMSSGAAIGEELSGKEKYRFPKDTNESKKEAITLTVKL